MECDRSSSVCVFRLENKLFHLFVSVVRVSVHNMLFCPGKMATVYVADLHREWIHSNAITTMMISSVNCYQLKTCAQRYQFKRITDHYHSAQMSSVWQAHDPWYVMKDIVLLTGLHSQIGESLFYYFSFSAVGTELSSIDDKHTHGNVVKSIHALQSVHTCHSHMATALLSLRCVQTEKQQIFTEIVNKRMTLRSSKRPASDVAPIAAHWHWQLSLVDVRIHWFVHLWCIWILYTPCTLVKW